MLSREWFMVDESVLRPSRNASSVTTFERRQLIINQGWIGYDFDWFFNFFVYSQTCREIASVSYRKMWLRSLSSSAFCFTTMRFAQFPSPLEDSTRWPTWIWGAISWRFCRARFASFRFKSFSSPTIASLLFRTSWAGWVTWRNSMLAVINWHIYQLAWASSPTYARCAWEAISSFIFQEVMSNRRWKLRFD